MEKSTRESEEIFIKKTIESGNKSMKKDEKKMRKRDQIELSVMQPSRWCSK